MAMSDWKPWSELRRDGVLVKEEWIHELIKRNRKYFEEFGGKYSCLNFEVVKDGGKK